MKKLLIGTALCGLLAAPALADDPAPGGEPMRLSLTQMDRLTAAGDVCVVCTNINATVQTAVAVALSGVGNAEAEAENENETEQEIN